MRNILGIFADVTGNNPLQKAYQVIEEYFNVIVEYLVMLIEVIGIAILCYAIVAAIIGLFKKHEHVRLKLAEGIALSLEFKIGGELMKTVIARTWEELGILGAVILLRAALTFLIQWEIRTEKKSGNLSDLQLHDIKTPLTQDIPKQAKPDKKEEK